MIPENEKMNRPMIGNLNNQPFYETSRGYGTGVAMVVMNVPWEKQTGGDVQYISVEPNIQSILLQLTNELKVLKEEVISLKEELSNRPIVTSSLLNDLANEKIYVKIPIPVIFEETDEECLVRWPEINAFGIGSTASEAIYNLKRNISDLYLDISSRDISALGVIAVDNLKTLEIHVGVRK